MTGWVLNVPALERIMPGFVAMVFNAALCFVLFSIALLVTQFRVGKHKNLIFFILSAAGFLTGFITLLQFLFHFNTGLDELFTADYQKITPEHLYSGRMAYNAAISFTLLGIGFVLLAFRKALTARIAQYLFHAVSILSAITLIGYLYSTSLFSSLLYVSSMATHTAVLFFVLSVAASLLNPTLGIPGIFIGKQIGNRMARRFFALMLIMAFILGSLRMQASRFSTMPLSIWVSLVTVCILLLSMLIIWNMATWLNGIDTRRSDAEAKVKLMNAELEKLVEKRTAEIQRSEEKYRSLIEQASDAIYVLDLQMNFMEVNDSMCKMIGYSKDELLGMSVRDIIDPDELIADPLLTVIERPDEAIFRERRFMRKDKTIFTVEVNVKIFSGEMVMVMARDITTRKRIENELKEAELKFRTLAEKSMVGVYITQGDKFIYVNPRFAEVFGYKPGELVDSTGNTIASIISDEYRKIVFENVEARYRGEVDNVHYEVKGKRKDGSANWVEFYGSRVIIQDEPSIIGTMLDITERKEAENLILKEKLLSDTIINSLPGSFYLFTDNGKFLRWNKNFENVTGYGPDEIEHLTPLDFIAPEDRQTVTESIEQVFRDGYAMTEAKTLTRNGEKIPYLMTGIPILYEDQRSLLGTAIDISQMVKAEEELRSSEQKYKLIFESNPLPLWMIARDNLTIIAVNDSAANLYGYSKDELINQSVLILRTPEDKDRQLAGDRPGIKDGTVDVGIVKHLKKDGSPMFVHIIAHDIIFEGKPVRLSLTNDVTEQLRAEESLQKSEANLKTILNTTDTAYALFDLELNVLEFNTEATEFVKKHHKHTPQKGDRLTDYFPPDRFPQFRNYVGQVLKGQHIGYEIDYPGSHGKAFWYDVKLSPITSDKGKILGMLMALYDITERKNTEEDLKSAYDRIQSHIESIKDMAWKQSHLIRSPLANLVALAEMLKHEPADNEVLDHFRTELDRLDAIIHEMAKEASEHGVSD